MQTNYIKKAALFLFFAAIISLPSSVKAQRYGTALGLRVGSSDLNRTVGLTLEQRIQKRISAELILQSDFSRNTTFSALAKFHRPIISKRFNYYLGAGPALGNEESFRKIPETRQIVHTYGNSTFGLDMIAGLELTVANAVISLDYKPNINISGREEFFRGQVGISARTVLVKSKEQKKRAKRRQKARKSNGSEKGSFWEKLKIGPAY